MEAPSRPPRPVGRAAAAPAPVARLPPRGTWARLGGGSASACPGRLATALLAGRAAASAAGRRRPRAHRRARASIWKQLDLPAGAPKGELRKGFKRFVSKEHPDVKGPGADRSKFDQVTTDYKRIMDLGDDMFAMEAGAAMAAEKNGNVRYWGDRPGSKKDDDTGFVYRVPRRKASKEDNAQAVAALIGGVASFVVGSVVMLSSTPAETPESTLVCDETGCEERKDSTGAKGFDFYESTEAEEQRLRKKWGG